MLARGLAGLRLTAGREAGWGEGLRPLQEAGVRLGIELLGLDCVGLERMKGGLDQGGMEAAEAALEVANNLHCLTIDCNQGGWRLARS